MDVTSPTPHSQLFLQSSFTLLSTVVLLYDHIVTFGDEVEWIWRRSRRAAAVMFLINRYVALFTIPITINSNLLLVKNTETYLVLYSCLALSFYRQIVIGVTEVIVAVVQFFRIYALYGRDRRIVALVLVAGAVVVSLSIWTVTGQQSNIIVASGCHVALSRETAERLAIAWEALFAYDLLIFSLTVYKGYRERSRLTFTERNNLVTIIYRDGAVYFGVMACAQCANIITFYTCPPVLRGVLSTFASSISVTMVSRFILNLHEREAQMCDNLEPGSAGIAIVGGTLQFAAIDSSIAVDPLEAQDEV